MPKVDKLALGYVICLHRPWESDKERKDAIETSRKRLVSHILIRVIRGSVEFGAPKLTRRMTTSGGIFNQIARLGQWCQKS